MTDLLDKQVAMREDISLPAVTEQPSLLSLIARAASDPAVDVAKMQALLDMQRLVEADQAKAAFNRAFARLEPQLPRIKKNGIVEYPVDKNKPDGPKKKAFNYARWEDVDSGIRPLLRAEGFSLSFNTIPRVGDGGGLTVTGELLHVDGHAKTASMTLPLDTSGGKSNLQGYASSTSFGQRYVTKMLLNLIFEGEDDDGQAGGAIFINAEQVKRLRDLIKSSKTDEVRFLEFLQLADLENIKTDEFAAAVNALLAKQAKVNPL